MVIREISGDDVLKLSRRTLGLPGTTEELVDNAMLAACLRRAASIFCPCSPSTLVTAVLESLQGLVSDRDELANQIKDAIEDLVVFGDLLELSQVTTEDPNAKGSWVFTGPPRFVVRRSGNIFLAGIVPDQVTPLPPSLNGRVAYEGFTRTITPAPAEALSSILRDSGFLEYTEMAWLKAPKPESATALREGMLGRLSAQPPSGTVDEVSILDSARSVTFYSGRWVTPKKETGTFIARRPQAYGASLWGLVSLNDGVVTKFLDFPLKRMRWRGCDAAWHLQLAIDHCRGSPQVYRLRPSPGGAFLEFYSPLPIWAQRRLAIFGRRAPREKCLFSYWISERELGEEVSFLQSRLWLANRDDSEARSG